MAADEDLASRVRQSLAPPTLRIYRWSRPAISLGRRQPLEELPRELAQRRIPMVRRPTGGGAVIHQLDELTYALAASRSILPPRLSIKQLPLVLHQCLKNEFVRQGGVPSGDLQLASSDPAGPAVFCFSSPVCGDLLYRGRKVAGSALRVWREAFLIQGSVQGLPVAQEPLQNALLEAVSATLDLRCPHPLLKSGI